VRARRLLGEARAGERGERGAQVAALVLAPRRLSIAGVGARGPAPGALTQRWLPCARQALPVPSHGSALWREQPLHADSKPMTAAPIHSMLHCLHGARESQVSMRGCLRAPAPRPACPCTAQRTSRRRARPRPGRRAPVWTRRAAPYAWRPPPRRPPRLPGRAARAGRWARPRRARAPPPRCCSAWGCWRRRRRRWARCFTPGTPPRLHA